MKGRVLIDGRALGGASQTRGIGTFVRGLVTGLHHIGAADSIEMLLWSRRAVPREVRELGLHVGAHLPVLKRRIQPVVDPFLMPLVLSRSSARLYHSVEWAQPLRTRLPVLATVHDLIPFLFPRDYAWLRRERLLALRQLRHADALAAVSQCTARDVARLCDIDASRITVIPHGVDSAYTPAPPEDIEMVCRRYSLDRPYVLAVGTFDPRKRLGNLLEVVAAVRRHHDVELVITGEQAGVARNVHTSIERSGLSRVARLPGYVSRDDLIGLYSGASCLIFPSAYEGFGLPVLEALACGTRVVAYDNSAFPEVAGPASVLAGDGDVEAMADAVSGLLAEPEQARLDRIALGRSWASEFTWERCARAYLGLYQRLIG